MKLDTRRLTAVAVLLCLAVAACFAPVSAAAQDEPVLYVVADVVKLRDGPSREAAVVANLRIATRVRPVEDTAVPDGWTRVAIVPGGTADYDITGYVASAFLSEERPSVDALQSRFEAQMAADDLHAARSTAERLFAFGYPVDPGHAERLRALYERLGDTEGAARMAAVLRGDGVRYLAYCNGGSTVMLAEFRPGEGLVPSADRTPTPDPAAMTRQQRQARLSLQRIPWFGFNPVFGNPGSFRMPETWVLDSDMVRPRREEAPAEAGTRRAAACTDGSVYSNELMLPIGTSRHGWAGMRELIQAYPAPRWAGSDHEYDVDTLRRRDLLDGRGLISIEFDIEGMQAQAAYRGKYFWGLYDGVTKQPLINLGVWPSDHYVLVHRVTWFKWAGAPERVAVIPYEAYDDKTSQLFFVTLVLIVDEENQLIELRL